MSAPQIIIVCLMAINIGIHLARHGEQRKDKYSVWLGLGDAAITASILWWGGFWN